MTDEDEKTTEQKLVQNLAPINASACDRCGRVGVAFGLRVERWSYAEWCQSCGIQLLSELVNANDAFLKEKKAKP